MAALTATASGCEPSWASGTRLPRMVTVFEEPKPYTKYSGSVERTFRYTHELGNVRREMVPVVFAFHGQHQQAEYFAGNLTFDALAAQHGFIVVYPQGLDDGPQGSGWNFGSHGDNTTCHSEGTWTHDDCYRSCATCGPCDWSTCHDDIQFVQSLILLLQADMCADPQRLFVYGESNGGMLVHHLLTALPGKFLGAVPVIGLPLLGYLVGAKYEAVMHGERVGRTSIFELHDRNDSGIPIGGGEGWGWYYEPLHRVLGLHASLHSCSSTMAAFPPFVRNASLSCYEYLGCERGVVAWCEYDGDHIRPENKSSAAMAWHFFESLLNDDLVADEPHGTRALYEV